MHPMTEREECGYCERTEAEGHGLTCPDRREAAGSAGAEPPKTIEQLAAEQGVGSIQNVEDLQIHGLTDEEADAFTEAMAAQGEPPQALDRDELVKIVGTALYGWGPTEPNDATGFTARFESEQVADAIFARLSRPRHDEPRGEER